MSDGAYIRQGDQNSEREHYIAMRSPDIDRERLVRLETKVDLILENQQMFRRLVEKHDERIKVLENMRSSIYAVAATIAAISAFVVDALRQTFVQR